MMQAIVWIMGAIAAYRLWESAAWLSVLVAVVAISYAVHPQENREHEARGEYSNATATRLAFTFLIVAGILVYSFLV
jgi:hypothetical protein